MTKIKYILFFFLSIVLFIVIFEFISAITMKFVIGKRTRDYQERMVISQLYKDMDLETYRQDYKYFIHNFLYDPYRGFKNPPNFKSTFVNTDKYGRRLSLYKPMDHKADLVIGMFGGSTMFGIGAEGDEDTIPGKLQKLINNNCKTNSVKIINNGVGSSNQTQSMIWLIETLGFQKYDYVIFYDFVNETLHAHNELFYTSFLDHELPPRFLTYQYGFYIPPRHKKAKAFRFTKQFQKTNTYQVSKIIYLKLINILSIQKEQKAINKKEIKYDRTKAKIKRLIRNYAENMRVINSLGKDYGFVAYFIMQPTLFTKKNLSSNEKTIPHLNDKHYINFEKLVYKESKNFLRYKKNFKDMSNIFDNEKSTIYIDDHHMSSKGNLLVAKKIFQFLVSENENICKD